MSTKARRSQHRGPTSAAVIINPGTDLLAIAQACTLLEGIAQQCSTLSVLSLAAVAPGHARYLADNTGASLYWADKVP